MRSLMAVVFWAMAAAASAQPAPVEPGLIEIYAGVTLTTAMR